AKTLALKRLQRASPDTASCYLQLRSRCLEKHPPVPASARSRAATRNRPNADPNPKSNPSPAPGPSRSPNLVNQATGAAESPVNSDSVGSVPTKSRCFKKTEATVLAVREASPEVDAAETEGSFGENVIDLDASRDN
ncbi:cyclin-dependent kinase inhibitor, partial [Musa troglodytarum]